MPLTRRAALPPPSVSHLPQDIVPPMPKGAPFASFFNPEESSSKKKK